MTEEKSFSLEAAVKVVGLSASLSLPASVLFDWGFFGGLGIALNEVPTSLIDHAKSAVFWFPFALAFGCGFVMSQFVLARLSHGTVFYPEFEPGRRVDKATLARQKRYGQLMLRTIFGGSALGIGVYLVAGGPFFIFLVIGIGSLWTVVFVWCILHPAFIGRLSVQLVLLIGFGPSAALLMWGAGHVKGVAAYYAPPSTVITVTGSAPQNVSVIRYMDKGILVRSQSGKAEFFQWSVVTKVESPISHRENEGVLCPWVHVCGYTKYLVAH